MAEMQSRIGSPCGLSPGIGFVTAWRNQKKDISLCRLRDSKSALCLRLAMAAQVGGIIIHFFLQLLILYMQYEV